VVTGVKKGRSYIQEDGKSTNVSEHIPGLVISDIWTAYQVPVDLTEAYTIENTLLPITPEKGSYFRYVSIPPDNEIAKHLNLEIKPGAPHPLMHKTQTLDYIIILSGEVYLILDNEETLLKAGDIVIQRGTNHAWSNRSNEPCIQLAILLGAKP
jgi:quercetin dioxygenase-like cupin family protein